LGNTSLNGTRTVICQHNNLVPGNLKPYLHPLLWTRSVFRSCRSYSFS